MKTIEAKTYVIRHKATGLWCSATSTAGTSDLTKVKRYNQMSHAKNALHSYYMRRYKGEYEIVEFAAVFSETGDVFDGGDL